MPILEIEREPVSVTSFTPEPDEKWTYTDRQGHEHYWDNGYPTLRDEADLYYCYDCEDSHGDYALVCIDCDEEITPGTVTRNYVKNIPGMVRYLVDGEEVSEEEFRSHLNDG